MPLVRKCANPELTRQQLSNNAKRWIRPKLPRLNSPHERQLSVGALGEVEKQLPDGPFPEGNDGKLH